MKEYQKLIRLQKQVDFKSKPEIQQANKFFFTINKTQKMQPQQKQPESKQLQIITYTGKKHMIDYIPVMTVGELKAVILQIDSTVPDFDFLYCGRMIRSNDKVLEDFINQDNMKLYTNAKGVHGGCFKVPNCG